MYQIVLKRTRHGTFASLKRNGVMLDFFYGSLIANRAEMFLLRELIANANKGAKIGKKSKKLLYID